LFTSGYTSSYYLVMNSLSNYLVSDFNIPVRDPVWGDMLFTPQIRNIIRHPQFQKLSRIKQLGPVSLVYPGAVHTRFAHCLGVYHISRRMMISLLRDGNAEVSRVGLDSFLVSALLHDIGHFPFAHSLKDVVVRSHESLATDIIRNDKSLNQLIREAGADIDIVCSIICPEENPTDSSEVKLYQHMLSGALDPDKLDYLCRDAFFCGVPYGVQDVSWITEHYTTCNGRPALSKENEASVEHLLFSKYLMYKNVYWHKATRCATAMVKNAVVKALKEGVLKEQDLYFLDDEQFFTLCESKKYKPFEMVNQSKIGQLFYSNKEISCPNSFSEEERIKLQDEALDKLKNKCEPWQVIVDLPEPISFESNIFIVDSEGSFEEFSKCDELFSGSEISDTFTKALRKVRVFSPVCEDF